MKMDTGLTMSACGFITATAAVHYGSFMLAIIGCIVVYLAGLITQFKMAVVVGEAK